MKVLVVEDEPLIRLGLAAAIEDAGHQVLEAANADEAVRRLTAGNEFRVVVTDVDMPGSMNGIQLAHYVRGHWPEVQILVISGKVGVAPAELPSGAQFLPKPYQEPKLINLIETLAARGPSA
jgi:two-component system, response regulator PdtaR